jgi:hypothetical protein
MYPVSERVQHQPTGYAFAGTAKASFLKISLEPKHADATPEAMWEVMAKQLYNDAMVKSQRGAITGAKLDSGEVEVNLSKCLQDLAVGLPELEGAAGDAVQLQGFTDALPENLQVQAYDISGDYDNLVASLCGIQKTLGKKDILTACQLDFNADFSDDDGDLKYDEGGTLIPVSVRMLAFRAKIRTETGMRLAVLKSAATNVWFDAETFAECQGRDLNLRLVVKEERMRTRWTW